MSVCNHIMSHEHGLASHNCRTCSNMEKVCILELTKKGIHNFPTGLRWSLYMPVFLPVNFTRAFYWSPFTEDLITKSLANSCTCKYLNDQGQVAVLCKTGSICISGFSKWRKEWKAACGFSAAGSSLRCCQDHPFHPLPLQCQGIPSGPSPLLKSKTTSVSNQARISSETRLPESLTHISGNNCYTPKG